MANQFDKRPLGERSTAQRTSEQPGKPSSLPPLPYHPNLKLALRSVTASLVLTYLEIHHPAPQDPLGGLSSPPVTLSLDAICEDLQVSRRTLKISLCVLGNWWRSEQERFAAQRAGREFINASHSRYGTIKTYSVVGKAGWAKGSTLVLRRNIPRLNQLLSTCGIQSLSAPVDNRMAQAKSPNMGVDEGGPTLSTASISSEKSRLAELLMRASVLDGDRRRVRYPRLRAAVDANLLDKRALGANQPRGKRRAGVKATEAVDPVLPGAMEARIARRRSL